MQRMPVQELSGPFSLLEVDAIGQAVTTPRGSKYILVFAEYFTRWVEAFPVKTFDTLTFVNLICRRGDIKARRPRTVAE